MAPDTASSEPCVNFMSHGARLQPVMSAFLF